MNWQDWMSWSTFFECWVLSQLFHSPLSISSSSSLVPLYFLPLKCYLNSVQFSSVQSISRVRLFMTPWIAARQASMSITNSRSSLRLTSIESVMMPSSHLILCRPLLLLPSIPASTRVFPMSQLFVWGGQNTGDSALASFLPKKSQDWSPSGWNWLDLLAVQGTLKSLLQHHSAKASILWRSAFFTAQLSHPYMTTEKTIAFTRQTLVVKVISLLLNMLSTLVITFLSRRKRLLISWLQSPSAVILETKKIKSDTVSIVPHLFAMKWWKQMP